MYVSPENCVAAYETGEEGIVGSFFAGGRGAEEEEHGAFVDEGEEAEVAGVLAGCTEDEPAFLSESIVQREPVLVSIS